MKLLTIGKNTFVAEIEWRRDESAMYRRRGSISKKAKELDFTYAVPVGFKFKKYQVSGFGFINNTDDKSKVGGKASLGAFVAQKAPNCFALFPIDHRGENLALLVVHGGVPIKELIIPTHTLEESFYEVYENYLADGDLFSDVERPAMFMDSAFSQLKQDNPLFVQVNEIRERLNGLGLTYRAEDIYSDLQERPPKSVRLKRYKGLDVSTIMIISLTIGALAAGYYYYSQYQAELEAQARRAAQAEILRSMSNNDSRVSQDEVQRALDQIETKVVNRVLGAYILNTGGNYPKDWPFQIVELIKTLPGNMGGFSISSITCSTIRARCNVIFNRGKYGVSVHSFVHSIDSSRYLTDWTVDPNRASAQALLSFNQGNIDHSYDEFESLSPFTVSAVGLSDMAENLQHRQLSYDRGFNITIQQPESIEFRGELENSNQRRLLEDATLPANWILVQKVNVTGSDETSLLESMSLTRMKGFGFTELVLEFDDNQFLVGYELAGSLIRLENKRQQLAGGN